MKNDPLRLRSWEWLVLGGFILLFAAQALISSPQKSAAFDEEYHLAAGYAYVKTGDFRMSRSHPPLINALSALPLLLRSDITLPLDHPSWGASDYFIFSDVFMWQAGNDAQEMLEAARVPVVILGALLATAIFLWARQWAGSLAGWAALFLATLDPNLLANARLVTTDLGLTLFFFVAVWLLWRWLERPTTLNLILVGVAGGLASASKFTGLMIWPTFALLLLLYPRSQESWRSRLVGLVSMGVAGYVALWAIFGFDVGPVPHSSLALPIPAPFYPYSVWDTFTVIENQPKTAYLLGQTSPRGWWYYFPVALAVKTPLPMLLLALGGVAISLRQNWRKTTPLWLPPALFLGLSMSGRITIGYRHILPIVPFLIALGGYAAARLWSARQERHVLRIVVAGLLLWQAIDVLRLLPHQEAYFNLLGGGPEGGSRVLVDSNLDWGQDLIALRRLVDEYGIDSPYLAYFGTALPEAYGLSYKPLPGFLRFTTGAEVDAYNPYTPLPGWYAISRSSLQLGLLHQNVDMYAYFRDKEPVARAGYSINLYAVEYPPETRTVRTVVTGKSAADLSPDELNLAPGQRVIVKWASTPDVEIIPAAQFEAETPTPQASVEVNFEDVMTLVGYDVQAGDFAPGETVTFVLTWRVGPAEMRQPAPARAAALAAFVHLSDAGPANILAQVDGWGTAMSGLEAGDIVRQRLSLTVPSEPAPETYYLQVGLYSPQDGQRLAPTEQEDTFIRLGPFSATGS